MTLRIEEQDDRVVATLDRPEKRNAIDQEMIDALHRLCAMLEETPRTLILTGSSGGGFAALQISALLPDSIAVAFNAQTDIRNYKADGVFFYAQRFYVRAAWPRVWEQLEPPEMVEIGTWDRTLDDRVSALQRYARPVSNRVYIVQNADEFHHADHFLPFVKVARAAGNDIVALTVHEGAKHVVPSGSLFRNTLKRVLRDELVVGAV